MIRKNERFGRWTFSIAAGLAVFAAMGDGTAAREARERPNVLLIVSDDQGYNDLSLLSDTPIKTPRLDRLAREGVRLSSFYVAWPACTPSRGSMLTGRYPQRNGTLDNFRNDRVNDGYLYPPWEYALSPERVLGMDTREVLLSNVLKEAGYANGVFGKWDLGSLKRFLPLQRGFDDFYGFVNTGIDYFTHERYGVASMYRNNRPTTEDKGTYTTDLIERETLRFIDQHKDEPFFIYVAFNAPHSASNLDRSIRSGPQATRKYLDLYAPGRDRKSEVRRKYMACVTAMDASIGRILDRVDAHGLTDDTIVIFLSDNGGGAGADNAPLRGRKAQMFEGGVRVPFVMRWPGQVPAGVVSDEFLTALEVFPTLLAATGLAAPKGIVLDGFDMLPVLKGERPSVRREMFWERQSEFGARVGNWKWVESRRGGGLFDLSKDLEEQNDLSKKMPEVLERVTSRFAAWQKAMAQSEPRGPYRDF